MLFEIYHTSSLLFKNKLGNLEFTALNLPLAEKENKAAIIRGGIEKILNDVH
jgi:hypothetical protein